MAELRRNAFRIAGGALVAPAVVHGGWLGRTGRDADGDRETQSVEERRRSPSPRTDHDRPCP